VVPVERKRLLPTRARRVDAAIPDKAHLHAPAIVGVDAKELAAISAEAADHGRKQAPESAVDPVDGPFLQRVIERPQRRAAEALGREVNLVDADTAVEQGPAFRGGGELVPVAAAFMAAAQPPIGDLPWADEEIEVVRAADELGDRHGFLTR